MTRKPRSAISHSRRKLQMVDVDTEASAEAPLAARIRQLQSSAGNAAVQTLLQRDSATETAEAAPAVRTEAAPATEAATVATPTVAARPTLRYGAHSDDVLYLQSRLNRAPEVGLHLAVDGIFGPLTLRAVKSFQAAHPPLVVDGVIGPLSWAQVEQIPVEPATEDKDLARKLYERGATEYGRSRFAHAYDFFTRAYELSQRTGLIYNRAQSLRRLGGRREEAIALYEDYLARPDGAHKAEASASLNELRGPAKSGDEETDKNAAVGLFERASALYVAGDFAHAYDEFSKAYDLSPRTGLIYNRAQSLRRLGGRRPEAIALYEEYLARPDGTHKADASVSLAELRGPAKTGDEEADKAAARKLHEKGAALFGDGKYALAYDEFTKAYELSPRTALLFNRAQSLRKLGGRRDEAMALFSEYLARPDGTHKEPAQIYLNELRQSGGAP